MTANLTDHEVLDRFAGINVWKRGEERAPHKPLLILYALARLQRGEPRLVRFDELEAPCAICCSTSALPQELPPGVPVLAPAVGWSVDHPAAG